MLRRVLLGLAAMYLPMAAGMASACGAETDCQIGDRMYRIAMPDGHDGVSEVGAIVFAHGYRGTAQGVMRNRSFRRMASDLGVALIAVDSKGDGWSLPNSPALSSASGAEEVKYFDQMKADAAARFAIDPDQIMVTGFSAGGMMVWTLACERGDDYAGFAPIAGTFWAPIPQSCDAPAANVVHIHGDADRTVPLAGRPVAETHQGDVLETLNMYRSFGGFGEASAEKTDNMACEMSANEAGKILNFCLFEGGHSFNPAHVSAAWSMIMDASAS
ncbi:alpha/beta hydrolase family esterase [Litoreibacter roseus]|uniref:Phospholipase/carboxylesterase/thioesterase domain-containing protein n=1 Tax=Litoreibacter roseus TaxID=2601869 RepID=A0A6N6JGG4_9RHOB|nr:prolyl oligopeptidase family serine peptidase [Litoreibacter roseus]GFE65057.1 hypothetical protein KIN_21310 [Litoreibacter roseus]